jgi:hypothetical protein
VEFLLNSTSKIEHGGRASLTYLKEHPEEDASVHVML